MSIAENNSEVAKIHERIRLECEAMERMQHSFASVASHNSILARYNNLGHHQTELAQHIGQEAATDEMMKTYIEVVG